MMAPEDVITPTSILDARLTSVPEEVIVPASASTATLAVASTPLSTSKPVNTLRACLTKVPLIVLIVPVKAFAAALTRVPEEVTVPASILLALLTMVAEDVMVPEFDCVFRTAPARGITNLMRVLGGNLRLGAATL